MKKTTKILALILSLALVCGALAVAAFAAEEAVTGVKTALDLDFDSEPSGALSRDDYVRLNPAVYNGQKIWDGKGRAGTGYIVAEADGNQYFKYLPDTTGIAGAYLNLGVTAQPTVSMWTEGEDGEVTDTCPGTLDEYDYVIDLDIIAPTGKLPSGGRIAAHLHGAGVKTTVTNGVTNTENRESYSSWCPGIFFKNDGTIGAYLEHGEAKIALETDRWTHLTFAITAEVKTDDLGDYLEITSHVWANGVYKGSYGWGSTVGGYMNGEYEFAGGDRTGLNLTQVRCIVYGGTAADADAAVSIDNITARSFEKATYTGNLDEVISTQGTLSTWEDSIYDRGAMPKGATVAVNSTTGAEYDDLQYAIDKAESGDKLVVCADVAEKVYVDKEIYVVVTDSSAEGAIYDVTFEGVGDWIVDFDDETDTYYSQQSSESVYIDWAACTCGLETCGETHPGGVSSTLYETQNIYESYVKQGGKSHDFTVVNPTNDTQIVLVGWQDDAGNVLSEDAVVTADMVATGYVQYTPILLVKTPMLTYTNASGEEVLVYDDTPVADVFSAAPANSTITLLGDIKIANSVRPSKTVTLDLNGKTVDGLIPNSATKHNGLFWLNAGGITFTIMSSEPGAKVYAGRANGTGLYNGFPVIQSSTNMNVVINGDGIAMYAPVIIMAANARATVNGGEYYRVANDHWGMFQLNSLDEVTIKNILAYSPAGKPIIASRGSATPDATNKNKIVVDNCVLLGTFAQHSYVGLDATVTNSYIQKFGAMNASDSNVPVAGAGSAWVVGEGCYVEDPASLNQDCIKLADGLSTIDCSIQKDYVLKLCKFTATAENTVDPTSYDVYDEAKSATYTSYVTGNEPITVSWCDTNGELLATTSTFPGWTAIPPSTVPAVEGWLNVTYTDWTGLNGTNSLVVPTDVTEYSFTLVEGSDFTYSAGTVPAWMNYAVYNHFELSIYIPSDLPEGIEIVSVKHQGTNTSADGSSRYVIDGVSVKRYCRWPGVLAIGGNTNFEVTYTYGGETFVWTSPAITLGNYAKAAFALEDVTADEKTLIADMLAYVVTATQSAGQSVSDATVEAYETYKQYCSSVEYTPTTYDVSVLNDYVDAITAVYSSGHGCIQFRFKMSEKALADGVDLKVTGMSYAPTRDYAGQAFYVDGDVSYDYTHNTKIYDFVDEFTITVVDKDGNEIGTCQYSFEAYMTEVADTATEAEWALLEVTLNYGRSAKKLA